MKLITDQTIVLFLGKCTNRQLVSKLDTPMSHGARKLLLRMLHWLHKITSTDTQSQVQCITLFLEGYSPLDYEFMSHKFNLNSYPPDSKTLLKIDKKLDRVKQTVSYMLLTNLSNREWVDDNNIEKKVAVPISSVQSAVDIYNYVTTKFLLTDFNDFDLNKIFEMDFQKISIDTIKKEAVCIDIQKRNVSYLYAVVRDSSIKDSVIRSRTRETEDARKEALSRVIESASADKTPFEVDAKRLDTLARLRIYTDVLLGLKDD